MRFVNQLPDFWLNAIVLYHDGLTSLDSTENPFKTHALLGAVIKAYKWELLAGVLPRLCQTGFTFAQPFLIQTTVTLFSEEYTPLVKSQGVALIGAYAIVYIGIAVCFPFHSSSTI
jgi:hypothetical protein